MTVSRAASHSPNLHDLREEVHVWTVATKRVGREWFHTFESWLSPEERHRHTRYIRERDRDLFLIAHALLRKVLSQYVDVEPAAWRFENREHGRPELVVAPSAELDLRFNISHTPGLAVILISDGIDAGVDVEGRDRVANLSQIARSVFSDAEIRALEGLEPDALLTRFYEFWTLKESYIKARGLGLKLPLHSFAFSFDRNLGVHVNFESPIQDDAAQWQFELWRPVLGYQAAVAMRRGAEPHRRIVFQPSPTPFGEPRVL